MTPALEHNPASKRMFTLTTAVALGLLVSAGTEAVAQGQGCTVGTRIEFADGGRGVGTILEIGTQSPHLGWYRVVFKWNGPNGDWYSPKDWGIFVAGTKNKCGPEPARGTPPPPPGGSASRPEPRIAGGAAAAAECPLVEPPGKVSRSSSPSAQLFKRVIFERAAAKVEPASISAPKQVGLSFIEFDLGTPYENTLTSSRFGDKRRHTGAPVGAMIYPVKTKELQCDRHGSEVRRSVREVSHDCFKNRDGDWTCPGRTTKFVENKLIPLK